MGGAPLRAGDPHGPAKRIGEAFRSVLAGPNRTGQKLVVARREQQPLGHRNGSPRLDGGRNGAPGAVAEHGKRNGYLAVESLMADNLQLVASTLEAAEIPYFLVPIESNHRYRVGVPESFRRQTFNAVADLEDDTIRLSIESRRGTKELIPAAHTLTRRVQGRALQAPVWRVYRPAQDGSRVLGRAHGCEVEFWEHDRSMPQRLWSRRWNKRGHVVPGGSATTDEMTVGDRAYPTSKVFVTGPHFDEVTFPVDIVYTWVDGDDPQWAEQKNAALGQVDPQQHTADAHGLCRYQDNDELRYSLRSVARYADFVRHIFIVSDGQVPSWLNTDHRDITVVDHTEIFPSEACLPTFNSHAIEARLHHISGLAEHYLYLNDDFFFGRRVRPEQFFHSNGMTKFFLSQALIGGGDPLWTARSVDAAAANTRRLIYERFGRVVSQKFKHAPYPQRRSVLYEMEATLRDQFDATAASTVRSTSDVPVPSSLFHYYAYLTGQAVPGSIRSEYVSLGDWGAERRLRKLRRRLNADVVCINDTVEAHAAERARRRRVLREFMESCWPTKSPFER